MTITRFTPHKLSLEKSELYPQEEMLEKGQFFRKLKIGIPKENNIFENRIILIPEVVRQLVSEEHSVAIESGAGEKSNLSDDDYKRAGAEIKTRDEVYRSEVIAKVSPFCKKEIDLLIGNQTIMSFLQCNSQTADNIRTLVNKHVTAIAMEDIKDENDFYPFVHSMREIAGIMAISIAGNYLFNGNNGSGILLGGITGIAPAKVVVLGSGTAGEYAAGAALGLGAQVKVFDNSIANLKKLRNKLGIRIYTSVFQKQIIENSLRNADVVIGAAEFKGRRPQFFITESMVKKMKPGAVIIDLNTDSLSCFETSRPTDLGNPTFVKHNITHYCVPNIASNASLTGSIALSNAIFPFLQKISRQRNILSVVKNDLSIRNGTYIYEGILTNEYLGEKFNIDYKDIDLLTAVI